jgi:putative DNA-invertase from lambdoid prophage Rac
MKTAIYHRVSTDEQDQTTARDTLLEEARRRGLEVVEIVEETGSGAVNNRPGLNQLMGLVRQRKIKAIMVWALDRFGRNNIDILTNIEEVKRYGCTFISLQEHIDLRPGGEAHGELVLGIMASLAQHERARIRARTLEGLKRVRLHGSKSGKSIGRQYKFVKLTSRDHEKVRQLRQQVKSIR